MDNVLMRLFSNVRFAVLTSDVPEQLVLSVVFVFARWSCRARIRLIFHVPSLVVVSVPDCGEPLRAKLALVWLFARVNPDVHLQVPSFVELLIAKLRFAGFRISTNHLCANEVLLLFFVV
jgi:hypothetical protein